MSNHFFSTNRGTGENNLATGADAVTTGSATTAADDIEVRLADAASLTKKDVEILLDKIRLFILTRSDFPIL